MLINSNSERITRRGSKSRREREQACNRCIRRDFEKLQKYTNQSKCSITLTILSSGIESLYVKIISKTLSDFPNSLV
jgi:hypothetical protein